MKILVCSDGHPQSEVAARLISSAPAARGARLTLLGIIEHPSDESALLRSIHRIAELLREKGISVEIVTRNGTPLSEIQKQTREKQYDLAVIGAERKNGGPFALSAKAYHIIKEVDLPVFVGIGERVELKRILICSGGNQYIRKAIRLVGDLASKGSVKVTLLHVLAEAPAIYSDLLDEEDNVRRLLASSSSLARSLRSDLGSLGAMGIEAQVKLKHGLVGTQIVREIEEGGYDLVVAGSAPSQGVLRTYVLGDITSEIVNSVNCAVLVVRGDMPDRKGGWWQALLRFCRRGSAEKS